MTGFKNIVATLYLKNGQAVKSASDMTVMGDVYNLCQLYNDSGIDKIIIFDLSTDDDEHEKNIHTIENINRNIDIKVCAGGNINRIEDVKSCCMQAVYRSSSMLQRIQALSLQMWQARSLARIKSFCQSAM